MRSNSRVTTLAGSAPHHLVRPGIRELVAQLCVGERLPGERELSARFGVARMTIRRSVDALVAEGRLERRHGSGTYVVPRPFVRALALTSFSRDMRDRWRRSTGSTRPSASARPCSTRAPIGRSRTSSSRPPAGSTGTALVGFTQASATFHRPSSSKPTTRPSTESRNPYRSGREPGALQSRPTAIARAERILWPATRRELQGTPMSGPEVISWPPVPGSDAVKARLSRLPGLSSQ
jgi:hypothetical protein